MSATPNVQQAVPFFMVTDIEQSLRFYVDGLRCTVRHEWRPEKAAGRLQWCWLALGDAALMLQEYAPDRAPDGPRGQGVSVYFICTDALAMYRDLTSRGVAAARPFVGNGMWVTSVRDPDGYELHFESETDAPEETLYADR